MISSNFLLGYPVTCLKFYANKEDLKADHQKMIAATCKYDLIKDYFLVKIFLILYRHSWLCQSLALSNSTVCLYI
jgi:hypothetical protein